MLMRTRLLELCARRPHEGRQLMRPLLQLHTLAVGALGHEQLRLGGEGAVGLRESVWGFEVREM